MLFLTSCNSEKIISENSNEKNNTKSNWLTIKEIEKREIELQERTKKREERNKKYDWLSKKQIEELIKTEWNIEVKQIEKENNGKK